jgi:DNA (cytosine-5)-methyltransferase 1
MVRNSLFTHFVRFVRKIQPENFIMEYVPGMRSMKTAKVESCMEIILQAFKNIGYTVDWRILNSANYGVPQIRRRIFIYSLSNGKIPTFPLPTHFDQEEG